jgi:hypothetical protein
MLFIEFHEDSIHRSFEREIQQTGINKLRMVWIWMQVAKMAQAHNLPIASHGVHDLHVHLLAASPK